MRTLLRYLGGVALVGLLVVAGTWVRVGQIGDRDERAAADAIVVLGAAQYDGDPSPVFRARLDHAAELYRAGVAPRIVTIGGGQVGGWSSVVLVTDPAHSARSALMARDLGWAVQTSPVREGPALRDSVRTEYRLRETLGVLFYRVTGGSSGVGAPVF